MTVDIWHGHQDSVAERAAGVARSVFIALFWMALVAGPPIIGGVLGWVVTREDAPRGPVSFLLGNAPAALPPPLVTREEVEAVGVDPRAVDAILRD